MISGNIAIVEAQQNTYSGFEEDPDSSELLACVNVTDEIQTNNGPVKSGLAAEEFHEEERRLDVNGNISVEVQEVIKQRWTRYWLSDNNYVVVQNKKGRFAFDLLQRITGGNIEKITFDIAVIISDYPGQWMGSFGNRSSNVNSGTLYGEDIENDTELGQAYSNSNKSTIGVRMDYNGDTLMLRIGESWFQVVSPGNYTRQQYLEFLEDVMMNYTT